MKGFRLLSISRVMACALLGAMLASCGGGGGDDEVQVMRALHIVAPQGSFAYFQLLWPQVEIVQAKDANATGSANYVAIEPASSGHLFAADASGNKQWLATSFAPWIDSQGKPLKGMEISAFLSGTNQTHTNSPTANYVLTSGSSNVAGIALYQTQHGSFPVPLVQAGSGGFIGTATGAPATSIATTAAAMIALYQNVAGVDLTPTTAEEAQFKVGTDAVLDDFARRLIISAKALRDGHSGTIVISMPGVDPHDAFEDVTALKARLNVIKAELNAFQSLLGRRSDDVLITIGGDTPKTPLNTNGWGDGTPSSSNWTYVVGKGYLKHGWFGRIRGDGTAISYDATTGADDANASISARQSQTAAAIAYAGGRGDSVFVDTTLGGGALSTYMGVVN